MPILHFKSPFNRQPEPEPGTDWSQQEMADFYRAHRLLVEHGAGIGLDCGTSDNNDPWMVFYDLDTQDVFLHVARTHADCVLICDPLNMRLEAPSVNKLILEFEQSVRKYLSIRSDRANNVVIHPAARVIMSMAAVFLLLKLESGEAQARAHDGVKALAGVDAQGDVAAAKSAEKSATILARVQQAFSRSFDVADAPAGAAMLAGMILAGELSLIAQRNAADEAQTPELTELAEADSAIEAHKVLNEENVVALEQSEKPLTVKHEAAALNSNEHPNTFIVVDAKPISSKPVSIKAEDIGKSAFDYRAEPEKAEAVVAEVETEQAPLRIDTVADDAETSVTAQIESDAIKALKDILAEGMELDLDADTLAALEDEAANLITDVSVATLHVIDEKVGFFMETNFDSAELAKLVEHFAANMPGYGFDYVGGHILIEQNNVAELEDKDIGMLTNVMSDGSKISIVGSAELIDDVTTFFG